jgi:hypothetical protein
LSARSGLRRRFNRYAPENRFACTEAANAPTFLPRFDARALVPSLLQCAWRAVWKVLS